VAAADASGPPAITTVAGDGEAAFAGDGGQAPLAALARPRAVAVDGQGNLFVADTDNNRIRRVSPGGVITTIAGTGVAGFGGDGGPATAAQLSSPFGVALDAVGDVLIADANNHRVRKVDTTGMITTVAGTGVAAFGGDGGPATAAQLNLPRGLGVDPMGNVVIADSNNNRVRRVDASGMITTVAGTGVAGFGGDGGPATSAQLSFPRSIAFDRSGALLFVDTHNERVRKVDASGVVTTIAGDGVAAFGGDGGPATAAHLNIPYGVAVGPAGDVFIADSENARVRKVAPNGTITTAAGDGTEGFSGDGGPPALAQLHYPIGVAVDGSGRLFFAERDNSRVRRVSNGGAGGYWLAATDGGVFGFGDAPFRGSAGGIRLRQPVVGAAATSRGDGYWLAAADGGVFTFGGAPFLGSTGGIALARPIVALASTPSNRGYWLAAADGGVFGFGDASFLGSAAPLHLKAPIVAMASTRGGDGYWLVASDGGVFSFGAARFFGSAGAIPLSKPVVGIAATPTGGGYWLVASDGGIFTYGDARFFGSTGALSLAQPVTAMGSSWTGNGYWLAAADGGVFTFGDGRFFGSAGASPQNGRFVAVARAPLVRP
jgi:sugar lactone lactonase YvrE